MTGVVFSDRDGRALRPYMVHSGMRVTRTEYDHGKRTLTCRLEQDVQLRATVIEPGPRRLGSTSRYA